MFTGENTTVLKDMEGFRNVFLIVVTFSNAAVTL